MHAESQHVPPTQKLLVHCIPLAQTEPFDASVVVVVVLVGGCRRRLAGTESAA